MIKRFREWLTARREKKNELAREQYKAIQGSIADNIARAISAGRYDLIEEQRVISRVCAFIEHNRLQTVLNQEGREMRSALNILGNQPIQIFR